MLTLSTGTDIPPPAAWPPGTRFVLGDPPWQWKSWGDGGYEKSPQVHYATMETAEICEVWGALGLDGAMGRDVVLALWATFPRLPDALQVMGAWGFRYVTGTPWVKARLGDGVRVALGAGKVIRGVGEALLIGARGQPRRRGRAADGRDLVDIVDNAGRDDEGGDDVIVAPRGRHSAKPWVQYPFIENLYPGPGIELFARGRGRAGWTVWGLEAVG